MKKDGTRTSDSKAAKAKAKAPKSEKAEREEFDPSKDEVLLDLGSLDNEGRTIEASIRSYDGAEPRLALSVVGKNRTYPMRRIDLVTALWVSEQIHTRRDEVEVLMAEGEE